MLTFYAARARRALSVFLVVVLVPFQPVPAQDSTYVRWVSDRLAGGSVPPAILRTMGPVSVAVLPFASQARVLAPERLRDPLIACAGLLRYERDDVEGIVREREWVQADSAIRLRPSIAISVAIQGGAAETCVPRSRDVRLSLIASGVALSRPDAASVPSLVDVRLRVDGELVEPTAAAIGDLRRLTREGDEHIERARARVYFDPERFAPRPDGSAPQVEVEVMLEGETAPRILALDTADVESAWRSGLEWFVARLDPRLEQTLTRDSAIMPLPRPADRRLREARNALRRGQLLEGSRATARRLASLPRLSERDALNARVQLGLLLSAADDSLAARAVLSDVARAEPCLTLSSAAPAAVRARLDALRPTHDCEAPDVTEVLRRSLVPGGGQRTATGTRRAAGYLILGAVMAQAGYGVASGMRSYSLYDRYKTDTRDPSGTWRQAEQARAAANAALTSAIAIWGLSVLESAWWAQRRRTRLMDRLEYGSRNTSSFGPVQAPRGGR